MELGYSGLINPPNIGIYWLRLFQVPGGSSAVAIVSEVPGNPGHSVTNAISRIATYVGQHFHVAMQHLTVFEVWPKGAYGQEEATYKRVVMGPRPDWTDSTRQQVERVVGTRLPALPRHDVLYPMVLDAGGTRYEEIWRHVFDVVPVDSLPPPHGPFRCHHSDRFGRIEAQQEDQSAAAALQAGRQFLESLTSADRQVCGYHQGDWKLVADTSVELVLQLGGRADTSDYIEPVSKLCLPSMEKKWLASLFRDPIVVSGGQYTNGQHRGCAARFSGAERVAVVVDSELTTVEPTVWTYLGD